MRFGPRQNGRQRLERHIQVPGEMSERIAALGGPVDGDDQHVDVAVVVPVTARLRAVGDHVVHDIGVAGTHGRGELREPLRSASAPGDSPPRINGRPGQRLCRR